MVAAGVGFFKEKWLLTRANSHFYTHILSYNSNSRVIMRLVHLLPTYLVQTPRS